MTATVLNEPEWVGICLQPEYTIFCTSTNYWGHISNKYFSSDVQNPENGTVTGLFGTRWFIARLSMVYGRYN
jgi:hypothetical protein